MEYRTLGKTGLKVSALGMGASPLGGVFGDMPQDTANRIVATAIDVGINFIDVAPYYGLTRAESVLGGALQPIPRERYILATKVGRYDKASFDFSAARVTASVDESLARLRVGHIDLIQCHDIEFVDINQIIHETLPTLRRVRDAGKVRFIGFSGLPLAIYPRVLDHTDVDTMLSYCHYCLHDTTLESLIPYLNNKHVGVINAAPLAMGLLSGRPLPAWHPAPAALRDACAAAARLCDARGVPIAKLALQFALQNKAIHSTFVGLASPEDAKTNTAWISSPPDAELLRDVLALLTPVQGMTWPSGRADNNA